jgi:hypothetical protein
MTDKTIFAQAADTSLVEKKLKDQGGGIYAEQVSSTTSSTLTATNTRVADTTQYGSNELVANSTTAGSVTPMSFTVPRPGIITGCRCSKTGTGVLAAGQRIHLFSGTAPTVTNGDNGAFLPNRAAGWLGSLDVSTFKAFSDGAVGDGLPTTRNAIPITAAMTMSALQETLGTYTPISAEVFTWGLDFLAD